jgi:vacuole morphology and inheritance protein 14
LIKDVVAESASTYVSVLAMPGEKEAKGDEEDTLEDTDDHFPTAFSLPRFIPLLQERIYVVNAFTRTFLVSWISLLDAIPDLELVAYLPAFLGGLFKFLSDANPDVHVATSGTLEKFLSEIKRIARLKRGIEESRRGYRAGRPKHSAASDSGSVNSEDDGGNESARSDGDSATAHGTQDSSADGSWVPGQDVQIDHPKILEILVNFLDTNHGDSFFPCTCDTNTDYA